jgi:hypothetical protein
MLRVAHELALLDQLSAQAGSVRVPRLPSSAVDPRFIVHKCDFTVDRLRAEVGAGEVLMPGPVFAIARRRGAIERASARPAPRTRRSAESWR